MRRERWLDRQPGWRLFFIAWAAFAVSMAAAEVGGSAWVDAYHPGRLAMMPPVWLYPLDLLCAAVEAAICLAIHRAALIRGSRR
jgi:hypothetical protein